jgi:cysteinyl-tRNA synthetase
VKRMSTLFLVMLVVGSLLPGCPSSGKEQATGGWVYQLQGYADGRLDAVAASPHELAVVDLARDAGSGYFTRDEIAAVRESGKRVLAYFEIGAIENYRPEHARVQADGLMLNRWEDWPEEHFVRYWDGRWWDGVVRPRLDQALDAGFDGVYLDSPLAYEEIDLALVPGETRDSLAGRMADLIARISQHAKGVRPDFWIVPQNAPELQDQRGYTEAIDGIGMEELFFLATDEPCVADFCAENLAATRRLRDAGKVVLAVDYATSPSHVEEACRRYREERFTGYVTTQPLDRVDPPCSR